MESNSSYVVLNVVESSFAVATVLVKRAFSAINQRLSRAWLFTRDVIVCIDDGTTMRRFQNMNVDIVACKFVTLFLPRNDDSTVYFFRVLQIWIRRRYGNVGEGFTKNLTGTPVDSTSSSHRHGQEVHCSAFSRFSRFHLERNLGC